MSPMYAPARKLLRLCRHPLRTLKNIEHRVAWHLFQHHAIPAHKDAIVSKGFLKKWLPKNPIALDCGAHDGADSVELANVLNATVHAFEPVPSLYERLKRRSEVDPRIITYRLALGDTDGEAEMFVSAGESDASSSLLSPEHHLIDLPGITFPNRITVQVRTLPSWAAAYHIPRIDLMWLDMQGFELQMLRSAGSILDTVSVIHSEVNLAENYSGAGLYPELRKWLQQRGFRVELELIPAGWNAGNVLFVRS